MPAIAIRRVFGPTTGLSSNKHLTLVFIRQRMSGEYRHPDESAPFALWNGQVLTWPFSFSGWALSARPPTRLARQIRLLIPSAHQPRHGGLIWLSYRPRIFGIITVPPCSTRAIRAPRFATQVRHICCCFQLRRKRECRCDKGQRPNVRGNPTNVYQRRDARPRRERCKAGDDHGQVRRLSIHYPVRICRTRLQHGAQIDNF